jgi:Tetracyclin repressor-like, C-terminal domain
MRTSPNASALNAEAEEFPELHRRYFAEIVAPRRDAMNRAICRGIAAGEIRPDVDVDLLSEVLVSPVLARMPSGNTEDLDPAQTSRRIAALVFAGAAGRDRSCHLTGGHRQVRGTGVRPGSRRSRGRPTRPSCR